MVYATPDDCKSTLGKRMQAFRADRPSEWLMDEFILGVEKYHAERDQLRARVAELEKDSQIIAFMEQSKPTITSGPEGWAVTVRHMNSLGTGATFRQAIRETMDCERIRKEAKP